MNAITKLSATVVLTALALTACGKDEPPPNTAYGASSAYPGGPGAPGAPGAYPQPGAPGAPGAYPQPGAPGAPGAYPQPGAPGAGTAPAPGQPAPGGIPGFPLPGAAPAGGSGGTAQVIDPNMAQLAVGPMMMYANSEAPGMQKEGNLAAANFSTGQTLEGAFTIAPGKCYTLVAAGVGVTSIDLEMFIVTPIPGLPPGSFAKNASKGAQTSIGGKANCVKLALSPVPVNAKWVATAKGGAGLVAVQLYSK